MNLFVDIALDSGTIHKSIRDEYGTSDFYEGDINPGFSVTTKLPDVFYGIEETSSFSFELSNPEKEWDTIIAAEEIRGRQVTVTRTDGTLVVAGTISGYSLGEKMRIEVEPRNNDIFETLLPRAVVTTDDYTETAIDVGAPVNICLGWCKTVPCPNIQSYKPATSTATGTAAGKLIDSAASFTDADVGRYVHRIVDGVITDIALITAKDSGTQLSLDSDIMASGETYGIRCFDYLVGYGPVEGLWIAHAFNYGVKREGALVSESDYTFDDGSGTGTSHGYTGKATIRFSREQVGFSGEQLSITADVKGLLLGGASAERNYATVIENILSDATWGLGESVDAATFAAAAAALTDWKCDGAIYEQRKAADILNDLLFICRSRLHKGSDGEWEVSVDGTGASAATLGDDDKYWDNCTITEVSGHPVSECLKKAIVQYDVCEISLDVRSDFGIERTYVLPFIIDNATAKKVLSYIYGRSYYADKTIRLKADTDAENLICGNVITVECPRHGLASALYRITSITKSLAETTIEAESYNASMFDDQVISDPTETSGTYETHDLQTIDSGHVGGMVISGTAIMTEDGLVGFSSAVTGGTDWRIWAGHTSPGSAPFRVDEAGALWATNATISGSITATTGTIGGFSVGATTLTGTNLILDSGNQKISLGTGTDICILDAGDATYRLAVGHSTYASAPFSVTKAGLMKCTTGLIGGWTINSTSIYTGTEDHSGYTGSAGDLTIYSSGAVASIHARYFYVDTNGVMYCTSAHVAGTIDAGGTLTVSQGADIVLVGGSSGNPSLLRIRDGSAVEAVLRFEDYNYATTRYFSMMKCCGSNNFYLGPTGLTNPGIYIGTEGLTSTKAHTVDIEASNTFRVGNIGIPTTVSVKGYYGEFGITSSGTDISASTNGSSYTTGIRVLTTGINMYLATTFSTHAYWGDSDKAYFGAGSDLSIFHNGSNSYIDNNTGTLIIQGVTQFDNNVTFAGNVYRGDNDHIYAGTGNDLDIYHDGSHSYIQNGTGILYLRYSSSYTYMQGVASGGHYYVTLFYDNSLKFATYSGGVAVTGHVVPSSADTYNVGGSGSEWNYMYSKNDLIVGDWPHLDTYDDLAAIHAIKGSGKADPVSGLELIDDNTIPEWLLPKYPADEGEFKKGDIQKNGDGKPYLCVATMIALCMGAIRQLDGKIEELKGAK